MGDFLMVDKQALYQLKSAMQSDSLIIFIGAGVSMESGLPSWNSLIHNMREDLVLTTEDNLENENLKVAQIYHDMFGTQSYIEKVKGIFNGFTGTKPNKIHDMIKTIAPRHIITTNYDDLIEKSFQNSITKYSVIKSDKDIPYTKSDHYLIKMHGDFTLNNFVLKEDDYLNYESNFQLVATLIKSLLLNNTVLFLGYSLGDSTFNSIFNLIQQTLGDDARNAYFFSTDNISDSKINYYEHRGVIVLHNDERKIPVQEKGQANIEFLKQLNDASDGSVKDINGLENNIEEIKDIEFVQSYDYLALIKMKAEYARYSQFGVIEDRKKQDFSDFSDKSLKQIENQTNFRCFLGHKLTDKTIPLEYQNDFFKDELIFLNRGEINQARNGFRRKANAAYMAKDYWHFLIAEYNLTRMRQSQADDNEVLEKPVYGNLSLQIVLQNLITNGSPKTVKIATFFRDVVLNFRFVYRTIEELNNLLTKIKSERMTYRHNGFSVNNHLNEIQFEFAQFFQFVHRNGIVIYRYREFKTVVNLFVESMIIAFEMDQYINISEETPFFDSTSTRIDKLNMVTVRLLLEFGAIKNLNVWMEQYDLDGLVLDDESMNYLMDKLSEDGNADSVDKIARIENALKLLLKVKSFDIVPIIQSADIFLKNSTFVDDRISFFSNLLLKSKLSEIQLEATDKERLKSAVECMAKSQMGYVENRTSMQRGFGLLVNLLSNLHIEICLPEIVDNVDNLVYLEKNENYASRFFDYLLTLKSILNTTDKKKVDNLLLKLFNSEDTTLHQKAQIVVSGTNINERSLYEVGNSLVDQLVEKLNVLEKTPEKVSPNPVLVDIADLLDLNQIHRLSPDVISRLKNIKGISGMIPEFDWTVLGSRNDSTIQLLSKKYDYDNLHELFLKDDADVKVVDDWILSQYKDGILKDIRKIRG